MFVVGMPAFTAGRQAEQSARTRDAFHVEMVTLRGAHNT